MSRFNFYDTFHKNSKISKKIIDKHNIAYIAIINQLESIFSKKKLKILDYGCGVGSLSIYLASLGHRVNGVDISNLSIDIAKKTLTQLPQKNLNIKFETSKEFMKRTTKYDLILCVEVIEHVKNDIRLLKYLHGHLNHNGFLFLTTPSLNAPLYKIGLLKNFDIRVGHLRRYSYASITNKLICSGFEIVYVKKTEGVLRNLLFTNPKFSFILKLLKGSLAKAFTLLDNFLVPIFGESNYIILAQKTS